MAYFFSVPVAGTAWEFPDISIPGMFIPGTFIMGIAVPVAPVGAGAGLSAGADARSAP
jgi:hypothetical protein